MKDVKAMVIGHFFTVWLELERMHSSGHGCHSKGAWLSSFVHVLDKPFRYVLWSLLSNGLSHRKSWSCIRTVVCLVAFRIPSCLIQKDRAQHSPSSLNYTTHDEFDSADPSSV